MAKPSLVQIGHAVVPAETPAVAEIRAQYNAGNFRLGLKTVSGIQLLQHPGGAVTPLDTPAVAAVKSQYSPANLAVGATNLLGANLQQHPGGAVTPVETPAVAAIKSQYNTALGHGPATDAGATINGIPIFASLTGTVPVETPEVAAIKSQYYSALGLGARASGVTINGVTFPLA